MMSRTTPDTGRTGGARQDRRYPSLRPFTANEEKVIGDFARNHGVGELLAKLPTHQVSPRFQRLIQEAIERKRRET